VESERRIFDGDPGLSRGDRPVANDIIDMIRRVLLAIFLLGLVGTGAELLLLNHMEDPRQWIPLILIVLGFAVSGWQAVRSTALSVRVLQALLLVFILSGFAGIYFHYQGSAEFKLESNPSLIGWALFREAIRAKAPPLLAPGTMIQLGLLGLAYTYRHPALERANNKGERHAAK
jgi:hypothetical protein